MKRLLILAAIFIAGCTSQQGDQFTPQQKDQIRSEVKAVSDSIIARAERLDSGYFDYFADSPDWGMVIAEGSRWDFQSTKKAISDFVNSANSYKWTTTRLEFLFMTEDLVICALDGKDEVIMKSGDRQTCDRHAYSMVFKKIAGQWKVVYSHDSGIVVTQKAGKK
jgi:hypothetical protein